MAIFCSFFRVECNYSTVFMYHTLLSQLSFDGHSGCLHVLADSAVMNTGVRGSHVLADSAVMNTGVRGSF